MANAMLHYDRIPGPNPSDVPRETAKVIPLFAGVEAVRRELIAAFSFEAASGLRSSMSAAINAMFGLVSDSPPWDAENAVIRVMDSGQVRSARIGHRTIQRLTLGGHGLHVTVLWLLCGSQRGGERFEEFGDLAPIAHLTPVVEEVRERLALEAGEKRIIDLESSFSSAREGVLLAKVERTFWEAAKRRAKLLSELACCNELAALRPVTAHAVDIARQLDREATAQTAFMAQLLESYSEDRKLGATLSSLAAADIETTATQAIRHGLRPFPGSKKREKEAFAEHDTARTQFISTVKGQAKRMQLSAEQAYLAERG